MHICKNCQNQFEGKYCNSCGQHYDTKRITWKELGHHIPHAFFHVDKGLFYSINELARRPGHTLREYLEGRRVRHFNPFLMVIVVGGICSILYAYFHFRMIAASVRLDELDKSYPFLAHKYYALVVVICCLWMTLGDYIVFRKWRYTLPELLITNIFICAQILVLLLLFVPLFLLGRLVDMNNVLRILFLVLIFGYCCWSRIQFFNAEKNTANIIKIVLLVSTYMVILYLLIHTLIGSLITNS